MLSPIFFEGLLVIAITKVQSLHLISLNGYIIYDETYNASMHQRFQSVEINIF